jgi:hypothetical protein
MLHLLLRLIIKEAEGIFVAEANKKRSRHVGYALELAKRYHEMKFLLAFSKSYT